MVNGTFSYDFTDNTYVAIFFLYFNIFLLVTMIRHHITERVIGICTVSQNIY